MKTTKLNYCIAINTILWPVNKNLSSISYSALSAIVHCVGIEMDFSEYDANVNKLMKLKKKDCKRILDTLCMIFTLNGIYL